MDPFFSLARPERLIRNLRGRKFLTLRAARSRCLRSFAPFELGSRTRFSDHTKLKKGACGSLFSLARPERFELPTNWFEASYSIQLSYGRVE